jgi:glycosyltransferase involved in cell wall biosynthesis
VSARSEHPLRSAYPVVSSSCKEPVEAREVSSGLAGRIAILSPWYSRHGHHAANTDALYSQLRANGYDALLISPWRAAKKENSLGAFFPTPSQQLLKSPIVKVLTTIYCLVLLIAVRLFSKRPVLAHCIDASYGPLIFAIVALKQKISYLSLGSATPTPYEKGLKRALRRGLSIVAETDSVKRSWEDLCAGSATTIPVAINEVPAPRDKRESKASLKIPEESVVLLFFGTHREDKDYETPIVAVSKQKSQTRTIWLLFAGPTVSGESPATKLARVYFTNATVLDRFVDPGEVDSIFAASDIVVLSYGTNYHKGSAVLLQAVAYSRPLLVGGPGYLEDFVKAYSIGESFAASDPQDFFRKLCHLIEKSEQDPVWFQAGFAKVRNEYSWNALIPRYLKVWQRQVKT